MLSSPHPTREPRKAPGLNLKWHLPMAFASVVLGLLLMLQFKFQASQNWPNLPTRSQTDSLTRLNKYLESERNKLVTDLEETRKKLTRYEDAMGEGGTAVRILKEELNKVRMQAGLIPVRGPGVVVTLDDSLKKPRPNEDPYYYLVHDVDIQTFVNELWAAGAEAVAVNDQRVVAQTSVRCVGPTVLVNSVRLTPPYTIRAIGAPATLETALKMSGGVLDSLQASILRGVRIEVEIKKDMDLPEFKGSGVFRYAEAVSASSASE